MKKLLVLTAMLAVVFAPCVAAQVSSKGWVTVRDVEGPEFERLRSIGEQAPPAVHYTVVDPDGSSIGGGSNGLVTVFVIKRPGGFPSPITGRLYLDTDIDVETGRKQSKILGRALGSYEADMGVDYFVDLSTISSGRASLYDAYGDLVGSVLVSTDSTSITVQVPVSLVGGSGSMNAAAVFGSDSIPRRTFLPVWEPVAAIWPTSTPSPKLSLVFQDQVLLFVVNDVEKLRLQNVVASLNGKDLTLVRDEALSSPEFGVYRAPDFSAQVTLGLFNPNRLAFGFVNERGFFSRTMTFIVGPALK